jgi:hypothetical protein
MAELLDRLKTDRQPRVGSRIILLSSNRFGTVTDVPHPDDFDIIGVLVRFDSSTDREIVIYRHTRYVILRY